MITTFASVLGMLVAAAIGMAGPLLELHDHMPQQRPVPHAAAVLATALDVPASASHNDTEPSAADRKSVLTV